MPGRGLIDRRLWDNRDRDPARLRLEIDGPKGRAWLLRWLPARAWENGVGIVFANNIGVDHDTIKPGLSMILDPHGEIVVRVPRAGRRRGGRAYSPPTALQAPQAGATSRPAVPNSTLRSPKASRRAILAATRPGWSLSYDALTRGRPDMPTV